jgi:predicted protein tyrosine phosphatase
MMWYCCRSRLRIPRAANTYSGRADIASGTLALGANASIAQSSEPVIRYSISKSAVFTTETQRTQRFGKMMRNTLSCFFESSVFSVSLWSNYLEPIFYAALFALLGLGLATARRWCHR